MTQLTRLDTYVSKQMTKKIYIYRSSWLQPLKYIGGSTHREHYKKKIAIILFFQMLPLLYSLTSNGGTS